MTPNYEDRPTAAPRKTGMPGWGWALIGCGVFAPLVLIFGLGAVLFPVFGQAREKARQMSCLSNLKQQGLGMLMYTQDFDETLPPKGAKWMDLMTPYIKNPQVFQCPAVQPAGYSYAMSPDPLGKKLKNIARPEDVPLLFDATVSPTEGNALREPTQNLALRHRHTANVTFLDGHARSGVAAPEYGSRNAPKPPR